MVSVSLPVLFGSVLGWEARAEVIGDLGIWARDEVVRSRILASLDSGCDRLLLVLGR
jgi:hypothetical protein